MNRSTDSLGNRMKSLLTKAGSVVGRNGVAGQVEGLGPKYVWGWFHRTGAAPQLAVICGGEVFPVIARWVSRADIPSDATTGGEPGFQFCMPLPLLAKLVADPALLGTLSVTADGQALPLEDGLVAQPPDPLAWNRLPVEMSFPANGEAVFAEAWLDEPFRVYLRILDGAAAPERIVLLDGDTVLDCVVTRHAAEPAAGGATSTLAAVTFEFELPAAIWAGMGDAASLALRFRHGDVTFPSLPVMLPRAQAVEWLNRQASWGVQQTYAQLLALEHARHLAGSIELLPETREYLQQISVSYRLDPFMASATGAADPDGSASLHKSPLFWTALREFNAQQPSRQGDEEALMVELIRSLPPSQGQEFIDHLAPFFLARGRYDVVKRYITPARVALYLGWNDTYAASMALPFLMDAGETELAAGMLFSISEKRGWLATEALATASALAIPRARASIPVERFAYAVIHLLDGMALNYWSRLHDTQTIHAFCQWLDVPSFWSNWLRRDLLAAALRHYGLSPAFWSRMNDSLQGDDPVLAELRVARQHFQALRGSLPAWGSGQEPDAQALMAVAYFRRAGNTDVVLVLREVTGATLQGSADVSESIRGLPLHDLLAQEPADALRLAALPVTAEQPLLALLPRLRDTLIEMQGDVSRSRRYTLQLQIGRDLRALAQATDASATGLALADAASSLSDDDNQFLVVVVFARVIGAFGTAPAHVALAGALLAALRQVLAKPVAAWPPQPVMSALASMRRAKIPAEYSTQRQGIESEWLNAIGAPRGDAIRAVLAPPPALKLAAPAGHDTLVVVYSCRKYLDSRVQAMRDSWLKDLAVRGIPYVVLVGDGDDTLRGDVLGLAVSDLYEDLPAKSLAMVRWVAEHTDFQYLLKIDDDCFLNVDEYFDSLSYRKFHYYGRVLRRKVGSMDRRWHQDKSQGERARNAIDKSPEPAIYADGGGAYTLSRLAMTQLLVEAAKPAGQRLVACSFMEDKLIGDLLASAGIPVANEDYYVLVRRRFGANATPVSIWDNAFAPSAVTPTKFAHLDTAADMQPYRERLHQHSMWPKKIWPTFMRPSIWYNNNQLELLTPLVDARRLLADDLFVVAVMRNEIVMAPHFLAHYRRLGVTSFIIVDNISDDGTREYLLAQPDVVLYSADTEYRESTFGVAWQQAVLANHCVGRWALVADADEMLVYPGSEKQSLREYAASLAAGGYDSVPVLMVDMYPFGDLADADFSRADPFTAAPWFDRRPVQWWRPGTGYYSNAANHVSALRHRLIPSSEPHNFTAQKYCLLRYAPWMRFSAGLHDVANTQPAPDAIAFAHFKYHAGFKAKVLEEVKRKQHFGGAQEYRKYLGLLAEGQGGFGRADISVRYADSTAFVAAARAVDDSGAGPV